MEEEKVCNNCGGEGVVCEGHRVLVCDVCDGKKRV